MSTAAEQSRRRDPPEPPIPARRNGALNGSCPLVQNKKITKWHRSWAYFFARNARFQGCFAGIRSVRPQGLGRVMISQPRHNSLAQNSLSRYAADHECCKRDAHQPVFGPCGRPERRESLHFSTCTVPACQATDAQLGARASPADPDDSPRSCSTNKLCR